MGKNIKNSVLDIAGVTLMPGKPTVCLGNGEQGFECCSDECDYYLLCFPEFEHKIKENIITDIKLYKTWFRRLIIPPQKKDREFHISVLLL